MGYDEDAFVRSVAATGIPGEHAAKTKTAAKDMIIFDRFAALLGALELNAAASDPAADSGADSGSSATLEGAGTKSKVAVCTERLVDALELRSNGLYGSMVNQESAVQACFGKVLTVVEGKDPIWTTSLKRAMGVKVINAWIIPGLSDLHEPTQDMLERAKIQTFKEKEQTVSVLKYRTSYPVFEEDAFRTVRSTSSDAC